MKKSIFSRMVKGCGVLVAVAAGILPLAGFSQVQDPFGNPFLLGPPVRIVSPPDHAVFHTPVDIPIFVFTRSEADFTNVELYANGVDLGPASSLAATNRPVPYFDRRGQGDAKPHQSHSFPEPDFRAGQYHRTVFDQ
jgi:hypothetical protein